MSADLKQGTEEWFAARVGKITGSKVGAVLGVSPFESRQRALRSMVEESMGRRNSFSNDAMKWGTNHEEEATRLYTALYAGDYAVAETGFWVKGDLGASPDRLVGDDGLVEIKCPYAIREDIAPVFKSYKDMPHYYHQVQMQLYCTDRQWCDFLQYTPHDHKLERIDRDPDWLETHSDEIVQFMEDYQAMMTAVQDGGPADRLAISEGWQASVEQYSAAKEALTKAQAVINDATENLLALVKSSNLEFIDSETCKVQLVKRKGSTKWADIAKSLASPDVLKKLEAENKGKASSSWKIEIKGGE